MAHAPAPASSIAMAPGSSTCRNRPWAGETGLISAMIARRPEQSLMALCRDQAGGHASSDPPARGRRAEDRRRALAITSSRNTAHLLSPG